jgi:hypothetical protein
MLRKRRPSLLFLTVLAAVGRALHLDRGSSRACL